MDSHIKVLSSFDIDNLPNLDTAVLGALELFEQTPLPAIDRSVYKHPLVVGSGNAEATGRIIYETSDALFASESNFEAKLQAIPTIDGVVLISASGGKHAPAIARKARELGKHVTLITNTPGSPASRELDDGHGYDEYIFPKNREPYTYNTSTYMGMILGATGEDPAAIRKFVEGYTAKLDFSDFSKYDKYYLIVPAKYSEIIRMLQVKFIELFGRNIARDIETDEFVAHATTVAPSRELFVSFGKENTVWGEPQNRLHVPLPEKADYAAMMAVGYYVVAQIQKAYPHYFKDNIAAYTAEVSKIFGSVISPIVDGD
jgi:hypothetical protein